MPRPPLPIGSHGEIFSEELASGRWKARTRVRDRDGRVRYMSRTAKSKPAAINALKAAIVERVPPSEAEITPETKLAALLEYFYEGNYDDWAARTRGRYREIIDRYLSPGIGELRVREASTGVIDEFQRRIIESSGKATAKLCRTVLKGAFSDAVRHGATLVNPVSEVRRIKAERREPVALGLDEVTAFRKAAKERELPKKTAGRLPHPGFSVMVETILGTGMRIGEVCALRWCDVDLEAGTITVNGTASIDDKTGKVFRQDHPKASSSRRTMKIPEFTAEALSEFRGILPPTDEDLVFPSNAGTVRDPSNVRAVWRKVAKIANLPKNCSSPHALRRTVGTLIGREIDIKTASEQLGNHENTARKHYVQPTHEAPDLSDLLERLGKQTV